MSRPATPVALRARSNGLARRTFKGGAFHGSATNLTLTFKGGLPAAALKKKLIAEVKAAGLPYGLLIRRLDDSAITASNGGPSPTWGGCHTRPTGRCSPTRPAV